MSLLIELRDWTMWILELILTVLVYISVKIEKDTLKMVIKEYEYDEQKDIEKKQRKTRTTKKTTTDKTGTITTEETQEVTEPMNQDNQEEKK